MKAVSVLLTVIGLGLMAVTAHGNILGYYEFSNGIKDSSAAANHGTALGTGTPVITWGPQITYQVVDHRLVRTESGESQVIARLVVGFSAQVTDAGTLMLTLVTQKQSGSTGRVQYQANQIEVSPKN